MHRYQRSDSVWADEFTTTLADYPVGFDPESGILLPAFIRYDCTRDKWEPINPPETPRKILTPQEFGDDWSEPLHSADVAKIAAYFNVVNSHERTWRAY